MINKEINELRTKIDNITEEGTQDMDNFRKKKTKEKCKTKWKTNPAE
jgi:hypothetical protein